MMVDNVEKTYTQSSSFRDFNKLQGMPALQSQLCDCNKVDTRSDVVIKYNFNVLINFHNR